MKRCGGRTSSLACSNYGKHVATPSHQLTGLTALRPHAQCFSSMARRPCSGTLCLCNSGTCHSAHQHDTLVQVEHHAQTHMLCSAPGLAAEKSSQTPVTLCLKRPRRACAGLPPARAAPTIVHAAPSAKPIRARFAYAIAAQSLPPPCPFEGLTRLRELRAVVWEALLHRHACWALRAGFKLGR